MFVSDSNLFPTDVIKVVVISVEGEVLSIETNPELTMDKLKLMALSHFYNAFEATKRSPDFKMVLVSEKRAVIGEHTVIQEELKPFDELLLVEKRSVVDASEELSEENLRGPTEDEIMNFTQNIPESNMMKLHPPLECAADNEIRKILISLVEASARLFTPSPKAAEVFALVCERLEARSGAEPDPRAVQQLMDMGFNEALATRALRINRHNETEALDWLLERQASDDDGGQSSGQTSRPTTAQTSQPSKVTTSKSVPAIGNRSDHKETMVEAVGALLDTFRASKRLDFKPSPRALQSLVEMGFQEDETKQALRITGNNQSAACEWLLGERRPSLEDLDTGLDVEGPIYKAIMANSAIRMSLTNPKMLLAFLSMLETPSTANMWINDPDASPVLSQIFKTYHAEKHALQMNRYVEQQRQHP